jgi:hypothetical protein
LIDLSASSVKPAAKFATVFCRPRPTPIPTAPEKIASVARLKPVSCSAIKSATIGRTKPRTLAISARRAGEISSARSSWVLIARPAKDAAQNSTPK